ncbi:MAG: bifunctional oligoribonuclease/PAP phosphatase NrnA [candidate division Zixibacteria bacterium]
MTQALINSVLSSINEKKRFLITSHQDPDGDSLGSQIALYHALRNMGKEVIIANQGIMPSKYNFMDPDGIVKFESGPLEFDPECVFVLECPSLERTGFVEKLIPGSATILNIDHHPDNEEYGDVNLIDVDSSAVGETLYLIFEKGNVPITREIAVALYAAIISDTGRFRFSSTTSRCMLIASKLVESGADPKFISDKISSNLAPETIKLLGHTLAGLKLDKNGKIGYVAIDSHSLIESGADIENSEGFVDMILSISGIHIGILFKELNRDRVKVSVRSQNGCDAAAFAKIFDGGGHVNAAGFAQDGSLDKVIDMVIARARDFVGDE